MNDPEVEQLLAEKQAKIWPEPTAPKNAETRDAGSGRVEPLLDKNGLNGMTRVDSGDPSDPPSKWEIEGKMPSVPNMENAPTSVKKVEFETHDNLLTPEQREAKIVSLKAEKEKFRSEMEKMRRSYAEEDYESTDTWERLKGFLRLRNEKAEDKERRMAAKNYWQAQYENSLIKFQENDLELIKLSGTKGSKMKEELVGSLRYIKKDEFLNFYR